MHLLMHVGTDYLHPYMFIKPEPIAIATKLIFYYNEAIYIKGKCCMTPKIPLCENYFLVVM